MPIVKAGQFLQNHWMTNRTTRFAQTLAHFVCGSTGSVRVDSTGEFTPVIQDGGLLTLRVLSLRPCARSLNPNVDRDTGKR